VAAQAARRVEEADAVAALLVRAVVARKKDCGGAVQPPLRERLQQVANLGSGTVGVGGWAPWVGDGFGYRAGKGWLLTRPSRYVTLAA